MFCFSMSKICLLFRFFSSLVWWYITTNVFSYFYMLVLYITTLLEVFIKYEFSGKFYNLSKIESCCVFFYNLYPIGWFLCSDSILGQLWILFHWSMSIQHCLVYICESENMRTSTSFIFPKLEGFGEGTVYYHKRHYKVFISIL